MNREAERKRLVESLSRFEITCHETCTGLEKSCTQCVLEQVADHLLYNGIFAPPVKINTFAYFFIRNKVKEGYVERIFVDKSGTKICVCYDGIYIKIFKPCDIGKTVFTSREDALKALEGSGEK